MQKEAFNLCYSQFNFNLPNVLVQNRFTCITALNLSIKVHHCSINNFCAGLGITFHVATSKACKKMSLFANNFCCFTIWVNS